LKYGVSLRKTPHNFGSARKTTPYGRKVPMQRKGGDRKLLPEIRGMGNNPTF